MDDTRTTKVRERAYELFQQRGSAPGDSVHDWLKAEEEVREEEFHHQGPARIRDVRHHGKLTDHNGCDLENPT